MPGEIVVHHRKECIHCPILAAPDSPPIHQGTPRTTETNWKSVKPYGIAPIPVGMEINKTFNTGEYKRDMDAAVTELHLRNALCLTCAALAICNPKSRISYSQRSGNVGVHTEIKSTNGISGVVGTIDAQNFSHFRKPGETEYYPNPLYVSEH